MSIIILQILFVLIMLAFPEKNAISLEELSTEV